ncbi:MSD1 [[Candida] subhashii]|uniref:MSD1 n=1 Tax=[Candida] subhashii TaxID=561895 RepID=A0A8J5UJN1_9ASCO|nr:MSD1 [[Candida] subhashii]KAG7661291.1 MSD1 [[Candida] subhashii]
MFLKRFVATNGRNQLRYYSQLPDKVSTLAKFDFPLATNTIRSISANLEQYLNKTQKKVTLNGHIHRKPRMRPTLGFGFIRDSNGDVIQILANPETTSEHIFELMNKLIVEDSVSVTGFVQLKHAKPGDTTQQWELVIEDFQILNRSNLDAARLEKLKQYDPAGLPPQFRYLQLRTPYYQNALRTRSKVAQLIRNIFIDNHDFVEIETPLLFKSTPEGAREFLVPTRSPKMFFALPQSPQQYKQILMSSGFTRYFQIAKCFRDENLKADRQLEFTQIDLEMSYINNSDQVGIVVEDLIHNIWNKIGKKPTYRMNSDNYLEKVEFSGSAPTELQFAKLDYITALTKYGIDKPDLRSNLSLVDLSEHFMSRENSDFPVVEACVLKQAFDPKTSKKYALPQAFKDENSYSRRKPYIWTIKNNFETTTWFKKLMETGTLTPTENFNEQNLNELLNLQPGDILAISTRSVFPYENPTPLGKFRQLAIQEFPNKWHRPIISQDGSLIENYNFDDVVVGSWVVNFPLFNPVDITESQEDKYPKYDYTKYESTHHPFTMAKIEDYDLLATDPLKVRGEHYDLVINGVEVGGGSRRIHDSALQQYIFEEILKIKNFQHLFGHLLKALSMGCPPHAGLALGFDRLCAMLIGSSSIRDVIAFPKNMSGGDPVVESPTDVDPKTLSEYYIATKE